MTSPVLSALQEKALEALETIQRVNRCYASVNTTLNFIQGDFYTHVSPIDHNVENRIVAVLDLILGEDLASYFLYECQSMKGGGMMIVNGVEYPIRTIDDVRAYLERDES